MEERFNNEIALTDLVHDLHEEQRRLVDQYESDRKKARIQMIASAVGFAVGFAVTTVGLTMLKNHLEDN